MKTGILFIAGSLGLFIGAVFGLTFELPDQTYSRSSPAERFSRLEHGTARGGLSTFKNRVVLLDCLEALEDIYGRAQPTVRRKAVMNHCHTLALEIAHWEPLHSLAWLVSSSASGGLGKQGAFNHALAMSQHTAPGALWLARSRTYLVEQYYEDLNVKTRSAARKDFTLLMKNLSGRRYLAHQYVSSPAFRARMKNFLNTQETDDLHRFVNSVRTEMALRNLPPQMREDIQP